MEIFNRVAVVAHVLVDEASFNVNRLVLGQLLLHQSELPDGLIEVASSAVHESLVEHAACEAVVADKRIAEALNGPTDKLVLKC